MLPLDRSVRIPMVHADDVAEAVVLAVEGRAAGAFNLAAEPTLTPAMIAHALGARHVHVPLSALRTAAAGAWHARVLPIDPGWLDLAGSVPAMDCSRAREVLGWAPRTDARIRLAEVVQGMQDRAHGPTPALRRRSLTDSLRRAVRDGAVSARRRP